MSLIPLLEMHISYMAVNWTKSCCIRLAQSHLCSRNVSCHACNGMQVCVPHQTVSSMSLVLVTGPRIEQGLVRVM